MSATVQYNQNDNVEDCRDFLRTGRCKYGASCKFNHPLNVQSGGGIKTPVDPSEPLFPIRLNEPLCQYYIKHSTCKFGQACKFNHPPQPALAAMVGGKAMLSQVPQHIMMDHGGGDQTPMMMHLLPQRPDEPDCIYFLRNGRCKYGATCRYHHPVHFQNRRLVDQGRKQQIQIKGPHVTSDGTGMHGQLMDHLRSNVQFVTTQGVQSGYSQQRVIQTSSGGHVLVQETPLTVIHVNNNGGQQRYRQMHVSQGRDYNEVGIEYETPLGEPKASGMALSRERATSSSSLASSFGTSHEHTHEPAGSDGILWNGSTGRSFSGGNLSSYGQQQQYQTQQTNHGSVGMLSSVSDGNFALRRSRAASLGSTGDHSQYNDSSNGMGWTIGGHPESLTACVETESWMDSSRRTSDQLRHSRSHQYSNQVRYGGYEPEERQRYPPDTSRQQQTRRIQSQYLQQGGVDQGLSLMTDALLTMLDTPEEIGNDKMRQSTSFSTVPTVTSPTSTPRSVHGTPLEPLPLDDGLMPPWAGNHGVNSSQEQRTPLVYTTSYPTYRNHSISSQNDRDAHHNSSPKSRVSVENTYFSTISHHQYAQHPANETHPETRWSPSWQEHLALGQPRDENPHSVSMLQSRHRGHASSHSDVGLYLP